MRPNSTATAGFVIAVLSVPMFIMPPLSFVLAIIAFWTCLAGTILCFFGRRGIGFAFPGLMVAALMTYLSGHTTSLMMSILLSR